MADEKKHILSEESKMMTPGRDSHQKLLEDDRKFLQNLLSMDLSHISDQIIQKAITPKMMEDLKRTAQADPKPELITAARKALENAKKSPKV